MGIFHLVETTKWRTNTKDRNCTGGDQSRRMANGHQANSGAVIMRRLVKAQSLERVQIVDGSLGEMHKSANGIREF